MTDQSKKKRTGGRPFKKGYDPRRNFNGRKPKNLTISDILRRIGEENLPPDIREKLNNRFPDMANDETFINALARVVYAQALQGESWAANLIFERCYGKVKEQLEINDVTPLVVIESGGDGADSD
jgi:hypothetical protein